MTIHVPASHAGYPAHPVLRDTLLVIGTLIIVMLLIGAAGLVKVTTTTEVGSTEAERMIEFRAGERELFQAPVLTESERMIEFRAGERELLP